jgi:signal transduction histidine kinase
MSTATPTLSRTSVRPLRVLIVDDSETDVDWISRLLRLEFGDRVEITDCDTGAAAIERMEMSTFDIALVDYRLPDLTGIRLLEAVNDLANDTAVVLLTGQGNESIAAQAIKSGAVDYLVKRDLSAESLAAVIGQARHSLERGKQDRRMVRHLTRARSDVDHYMRSLSHDMTANLMVLEHSFEKLKHHFPHYDSGFDGMNHVEACLKESKRYLDDLSKLAKTGSVSQDPERVELDQLVADVLLELAPLLDARQIVVDVDAGLPGVWMNSTRCRQVISNLLRNAIHHGCSESMPRIEVSASPRTGQPTPAGFVWLRVHDNGPGIPLEAQRDIFLPGHRLPTAGPGTGMGLAIVKRIVDECGGRISLESDGRGTTFWLALPTA